MKTVSSILAGLTALLTAALLSIAAYLAFIAPKTIATWQEEGRAISVLEKLIVTGSHACSTFGIVILPVILLAFSASIVWLIYAIKGNSTNKTLQSAENIT